MKKQQRIRIAVLMGGPSSEYEVSVHTGKQILVSLDPKRYAAIPVVINKKGEWTMPPAARGASAGKIKKMLPQMRALDTLRKKVDVLFIALHGTFGEDGTIQALCDQTGIPYTGSGARASSLGMDKDRSSRIFRAANMRVPAFRVLSVDETEKRDKNTSVEIIRALGLPLVVKPSDQGSSVGVSIIKKIHHMPAAIDEAKKYSPHVMIQRFIKGREITCGVIDRTENGKRITIALPPIEVIPRRGAFYDYASKYARAGSDHVIPPANMSPVTIKKIQDTACRAHGIIGCAGMSRSDFILGDNGMLYILEINTIPGMTSTSLLPQAAKAAGIDFPNLLDIIVNIALQGGKRR